MTSPYGDDLTFWHYTSLDVFKEIVTTRILHATQIGHLNDAEEVLEGFKFARPADDLLDRLKRDAHPNYEHYSLLQKKFDNAVIKELPLFVTSFSKIGDKKTQWQGYTHDGLGVAIGFSRNATLDRLFAANGRYWDCLYDEETQRMYANGFFGMEVVRRMIKVQQPPSGAVDYAWNNGLPYFGRIKNLHFEDEREVRAIIRADINGPDVGRDKKDRPFIKWKFAVPGDPLPIIGAYISPTPNPSVKPTVERLMSTHAVPGSFQILDSTVPLRW